MTYFADRLDSEQWMGMILNKYILDRLWSENMLGISLIHYLNKF